MVLGNIGNGFWSRTTLATLANHLFPLSCVVQQQQWLYFNLCHQFLWHRYEHPQLLQADWEQGLDLAKMLGLFPKSLSPNTCPQSPWPRTPPLTSSDSLLPKSHWVKSASTTSHSLGPAVPCLGLCSLQMSWTCLKTCLRHPKLAGETCTSLSGHYGLHYQCLMHTFGWTCVLILPQM